MSKPLFRTLFAAALTLGASIAPAEAKGPEAEIGFIAIDKDITLRRMVVRSADPKGVVLLLHGFPETLYAWQDISQSLGDDYEVHAFDWPGYGLSSRPSADTFAYAPRDYARVLKDYIRQSGIDPANLTIYATDIGALPALLAALEDPGIARTIIVGDFAPFDRPQHMQERLQALKSPATADLVRAGMNKTRDEIVENAMRRGLAPEAQFEISPAFKADMLRGWNHGELTSADAFYHYYSAFTRDQDHLEANIGRLKTPVRVVWGADDFYISKEMGIEFADRARTEITLVPDVGHYPHLQAPEQAVAEIRASFAPTVDSQGEER